MWATVTAGRGMCEHSDRSRVKGRERRRREKRDERKKRWKRGAGRELRKKECSKNCSIPHEK